MGVRLHPLAYRRYWDATLNTVGGCRPLSPGSLNCYAALAAGTLQTSTDIALYRGTTKQKGGRFVFNGRLTVLRPGHANWTFPLRWKGAAKPLLGPGKPSLIFVSDMAELFLPERPREHIDRTIGTLVISDHIGLLLTKCPEEMATYMLSQPKSSQPRWQAHLWLGFSAERQKEFDLRWPPMRELAQRGFLVFVSIAPMLGPVTLPPDFLALGRWVIVSGEQGPQQFVRDMRPSWARNLRDQCVAAGIPFFMKQMAGNAPILFDLLIWEFPRL